ncbi:uncharacterized protein LOC108632295 isoform X2 [Ceratina calcarata]|uniref:Uncharacterized protein LOC108632295 isoform X2 n=1 Tax=Ceratina calcarata TaxID=156304 RepID=A0AAJ7NF87_9HYME|nr:uncharacterized protein LOC108632295 isoform X2 [Ceratina calcarata]
MGTMHRRERGKSRDEKGSQNDIKKLRRENEQLRREIWSLRDEYDKLEEILKRQKGRADSEEYEEDRSDEDDGLQSDYSFEDEEEPDRDTQDSSQEPSKPEQIENAENQKISSEKMTSNTLHRLHVDFDDLSVVDEEEEPKKDKDKKKVCVEDAKQSKEEKTPLSILKSRQLHENIPFYPGAYQPACTTSPSYYTECPFKFPSTANLMMPMDTMLASPCSRLNVNQLVSVPNLVDPLDQLQDQILHAPPAGWQSNVMVPQKQTAFGLETNGTSGMQSLIHQDQAKLGPTSGFSNLPSFVQRRTPGLKSSSNPFSPATFGNAHQNPEKIVENGWGTNASSKSMIDQGTKVVEMEDGSESEKPKHFFAPLASKLKRQTDESSPTISQFGTGNSSSSGKTGSTVISKNQFTLQKGSADVYVNGMIPRDDGFQRNRTEQRTFLSTENLLVDDAKPGNQLTKSMSCQDLSSETQTGSIGHPDGRQQMMTQSDNTLDNISDSKPYKSHLSVTLKTPRAKQAISPETPEVPQLPAIDYRLFKNPFLRSFDTTAGYTDQASDATRPLSVQVNDDNLCYYSPQPEPSTLRRVPFAERYKTLQADQSRLLIPSNRLVNEKLISPTSKHQIQVTSFERPSPHTLIGPSSPYELSTLCRLNANPYLQSSNLYQNMPFLPRGSRYPQRGMMYYDNQALKVPAQTQTSIDGDSHHEDELSHEESAPNTPSGQRRRKVVRKEKANKEQKPLSPNLQRKLRKQSSATSSEVTESVGKVPQKRSRRFSVNTTTTSEGQEDKNDSRSSSSGQDSPKKEQVRRVSLYFNAKKRPSLASVRTTRSASIDVMEKDAAMNSERERTNSISSREMGAGKSRKASTSSGNVPWCACWGNGCV